MADYEFEYMIIAPKQETIKGIKTISSSKYWSAYYDCIRILKQEYKDHGRGTNVFVKRHDNEP